MTDIFLGPRGSGRTKAAVAIACNINGVLIVPTQHDVDRVSRDFPQMPLDQVVSASTAINHPARLSGRPVVVDDADVILSQVFGARINLMTLHAEGRPEDHLVDLAEDLEFERFRQLAIAKQELRNGRS